MEYHEHSSSDRSAHLQIELTFKVIEVRIAVRAHFFGIAFAQDSETNVDVFENRRDCLAGLNDEVDQGFLQDMNFKKICVFRAWITSKTGRYEIQADIFALGRATLDKNGSGQFLEIVGDFRRLQQSNILEKTNDVDHGFFSLFFEHQFG